METRKLREQIKGSVKYISQKTLYSNIGIRPPDSHLADLAFYAGVKMNPKIFKIILDLLQMNVDPLALARMLTMMCSQNRKVTPDTENTLKKQKKPIVVNTANRQKENVTHKTTKERGKKAVPNAKNQASASTRSSQSVDVRSGLTGSNGN